MGLLLALEREFDLGRGLSRRREGSAGVKPRLSMRRIWFKDWLLFSYKKTKGALVSDVHTYLQMALVTAFLCTIVPKHN